MKTFEPKLQQAVDPTNPGSVGATGAPPPSAPSDDASAAATGRNEIAAQAGFTFRSTIDAFMDDDGVLTMPEFFEAANKYATMMGDDTMLAELEKSRAAMLALEGTGADKIVENTTQLFLTERTHRLDEEKANVDAYRQALVNILGNQIEFERSEEGIYASAAAFMTVIGKLATAFGQPAIGQQLLQMADEIRPDADDFNTRYADLTGRIAEVDTSGILADYDASKSQGAYGDTIKEAIRRQLEQAGQYRDVDDAAVPGSTYVNPVSAPDANGL